MEGSQLESAARNKVLFREVNDRMVTVYSEFSVDEEPEVEIFCECGRAECRELISVPRATYRATRDEPTHFIVLHGHELPAIESVIGSEEIFSIVSMSEGRAGEIAREGAAAD
jgi:hypothetical protein